MRNQLILVEGIPGVGKTTMAKKIKEHFDKQNIQSKLYLEGDFNHPADYECVAHFHKDQYNELLEKFNVNEKIISEYVEIINTDYFIKYGMIRENQVFNQNKALLQALASNDVYSLPTEKFIQVTKDRWKKFVNTTENDPYIYIFECCFFRFFFSNNIFLFLTPCYN
jgi:tRNA uridine 5-carbamoylmethylation protein Kti12